MFSLFKTFTEHQPLQYIGFILFVFDLPIANKKISKSKAKFFRIYLF
jgi:hypothetical protein